MYMNVHNIINITYSNVMQKMYTYMRTVSPVTNVSQYNIYDYVYYNTTSYGNSIHIGKYLVVAFVIMCIVTPFTNWLIPILSKPIYVMRWYYG
jgi:hypothetical protein